MKVFKLPAILILLLLFIISCGKIEKLPPEPSITFKSFEVFDTVENLLGNKIKGGRLNFHFQDGDGDLGAPNETITPNDTNLFLILYRLKGGKFQKVQANDYLYPAFTFYTIPNLDRKGQNKILHGNIGITILFPFFYPADTVKFRFFVKDRALHLSNVDSTCIIVLTMNGICEK